MPIKHITVEKEYEKNNDLKKEDIKHLQEWAEKQPHLPQITENQMILFLHSCYYRIELAKLTIDLYYSCRTHCPEFFSDRTLKNQLVIKANQMSYTTRLPGYTSNGYRPIYSKIVNSDTSLFDFASVLKRNQMLMDLWLLEDGTEEGIVLVLDLDGCTFGHVTKLGIMTMKKFLFYLQEALPIRLKAIHYINTVPFMDKIMALIKPFMKKELMDVTFLWNSNALEKFYEHVPQKIMPKEFGGDYETHSVLLEQQNQYLEENLDWFIYDEHNNRIDENKRPGKAKNAGDLFGVEGSFKKLDID